MNWDKIYNQIMDYAKTRILTGYSESHHVVPRCMGGNNDISNIRRLTAREHFIAHQLLVKMVLYQQHPNRNKLVFAAHMMTISSSNQVRSSHDYQWLKEAFSVAMSELQSTRVRSEQHKANQSKALIGNIRALGTKRTDDSKEKISKALTGKIRSTEHCQNLSKALSKPRKLRGSTGKPAWNVGLKAPIENNQKSWKTRRERALLDPSYNKVKIPRDPEHTRKIVESRKRNKENNNG